MPAPAGDHVVQPAVDRTGFRDEPGLIGQLDRDQRPQVGTQVLELIRVDLAAGQADRLALQGPANLADLADLPRGHPPDDGSPVGCHVQQAHPREHHQGLADRRVAHAEPPGQGLRHQMLAGADLAVDDLLEQRFHEHLPAQAVIPWLRGR